MSPPIAKKYSPIEDIRKQWADMPEPSALGPIATADGLAKARLHVAYLLGVVDGQAELVAMLQAQVFGGQP